MNPSNELIRAAANQRHGSIMRSRWFYAASSTPRTAIEFYSGFGRFAKSPAIAVTSLSGLMNFRIAALTSSTVAS